VRDDDSTTIGGYASVDSVRSGAIARRDAALYQRDEARAMRYVNDTKPPYVARRRRRQQAARKMPD